MGTPTTVCVNDDLTTGQAGVTLLTTVHSATDNIKINVNTEMKFALHSIYTTQTAPSFS